MAKKKKYNLTPRQELHHGTMEEGEHTSNKREMKKIAMDHLREDPNYYTKLANAGLMERSNLPKLYTGFQGLTPLRQETLEEQAWNMGQRPDPITMERLEMRTPDIELDYTQDLNQDLELAPSSLENASSGGGRGGNSILNREWNPGFGAAFAGGGNILGEFATTMENPQDGKKSVAGTTIKGVGTGAAAGFSVGGPIGALVGGAIGGLTSGLGARKQNKEIDKQLAEEEDRERFAYRNKTLHRSSNIQVPMYEDGVAGSNDQKLVEVERDEIILRRRDNGSYELKADFQGGKTHEQGGEDTVIEEGDVVFPGKDRKKVLQYLKMGNYPGLESMRLQLPQDLPQPGAQLEEGVSNVNDLYSHLVNSVMNYSKETGEDASDIYTLLEQYKDSEESLYEVYNTLLQNQMIDEIPSFEALEDDVEVAQVEMPTLEQETQETASNTIPSDLGFWERNMAEINQILRGDVSLAEAHRNYKERERADLGIEETPDETQELYNQFVSLRNAGLNYDEIDRIMPAGWKEILSEMEVPESYASLAARYIKAAFKKTPFKSDYEKEVVERVRRSGTTGYKPTASDKKIYQEYIDRTKERFEGVGGRKKTKVFTGPEELWVDGYPIHAYYDVSKMDKDPITGEPIVKGTIQSVQEDYPITHPVDYVEPDEIDLRRELVNYMSNELSDEDLGRVDNVLKVTSGSGITPDPEGYVRTPAPAKIDIFDGIPSAGEMIDSQIPDTIQPVTAGGGQEEYTNPEGSRRGSTNPDVLYNLFDYSPAIVNMIRGTQVPERVDRRYYNPEQIRYRDTSQQMRREADILQRMEADAARRFSGGSAQVARAGTAQSIANRFRRKGAIDAQEAKNLLEVDRQNTQMRNQARMANLELANQYDELDAMNRSAVDAYMDQGLHDFGRIINQQRVDDAQERIQNIILKNLETKDYLLTPELAIAYAGNYKK